MNDGNYNEAAHRANMALDAANKLREEIKSCLKEASYKEAHDRDVEDLMHLANYLLGVVKKLDRGDY